jgi:PAS domain S-box-containing protein
MKLPLPQSLRARLVLLIAISTLPAMGIMSYTAFERYHTAVSYAYGIGHLAADQVATRYQELTSRTRELLAVMAQLPALDASAPECNRALASLRARIPLYVNLSVVSLDGKFRCSAIPLAAAPSVSNRGWFRQVLRTRHFTSDVISRGLITHRSQLIFSVPHYAADGQLISILNAVMSPEALAPTQNEALLERYGALAVFSGDGTLLMRYPQDRNLLGSDQSHSALFQALRGAADAARVSLPGLNGQPRIFSLRRVPSDVPQHDLLIASGIAVSALRAAAFVPLARELAVVALAALLIMLTSWWAASTLVTQRLRHLLDTLQHLASGEWQARTGLAEQGGEFGLLATGIDRMAANLESQAHARRAIEQARVTSEQRYARLIEQAVEAITVRRATGEYILVNAAFCKLLGYSRDELLRMRITDVIEPSEQRGHLLKPGESARFESWMYHKDGHKVFVDVSTLCLPNGDIQSVQRDIGERLAMRRQLEDSERQYRELVEQTMIGILVRRPNGEILFANRALCQMTGYRRDELLGMHMSQLVAADEAQAIQRINQLATGENANFQSRLRHKDGHIIHLELSASRRQDGNIQVLINDISTRIEAEWRLLEERQFVLHALDVLPGVFYVYDADGKFLRWNRQMEEVTGYSMQEMRQITAAEIVPPERRAHHHESVRAILRGTGMHGETMLYTKDGQSIPYYYAARNFMWRGQPCVVGMGVDISARREAERRVQDYLQELQRLSLRLLQAQEEERRRLAGELHDEMGQNLLTVLLQLRELEAKAPRAQQAAIHKVSALTTELSEQVRSLSLDLRPVMLDDLGLTATLRWYVRERVAVSGVKVKLDLDPGLSRLPMTVETTCFRVLQSALTNVLKHAQARKVDVQLRVQDGALHFSVEDDGCGFDVDAAQLRAAAGKSFGLLGMQERVRLAGGKFAIRSALDRGTRIEVSLPLAMEPMGSAGITAAEGSAELSDTRTDMA